MSTNDQSLISRSKGEKVKLSRLGLEVLAELSFDEWREMASRFGSAMASAAFAIGDWLNYGENHFGVTGREIKRIASSAYDAALAATGLDKVTLHAYAYVARRVGFSLRNKDLSWEHHKAIAKLDEAEQERWLKLAEDLQAKGEPLSSRRLRKSIIAGRLLAPDELQVDPADRAIENHIPFVNRLVSWWGRMREKRWLAKASKEQRATLKRDLLPVVEIWREL